MSAIYPNLNKCTHVNSETGCALSSILNTDALLNDSITNSQVNSISTNPMIKPLKEQIDHPSHYNQGKIEVVDAIADWGLNFQLGNVVKYTARAGHKDDILVDLEKAKWYLQYEIDRIKKEREA